MTQVSVIIPCYLSSKTIARAVDSVANQTLLPSEVILIDDASPDNGETLKAIHDVAKQYVGVLNIKVVELLQNKGVAGARNAGWAVAKEAYIAFLDSDDSWHPQKIEIQYRFMRDKSQLALCGHRCILVSEYNQQDMANIDGSVVTKSISANSLIFKTAFSTPSIMLKRDINFRFNESQRYAEDAYLWQLIAFSGLKVIRIESNLAFIHKKLYGSTGLSSHMLKMEQAEIANFINLYKAKKISIILMLFASIFSLIKFIRRLIIVQAWSKKDDNN